MSELRRYYWDSSVFCSFLNEEKDRCQIVEDLLKEARSGFIEIVTSSFTTVEVLKLKGSIPIGEEKEAKITQFFEFPFIKIVDANRNVCEIARRYVWKHGMKPKDAVHAATAEVASRLVSVHELFSWDEDFVKLSGKVGLQFKFSRPYMLQTLLALESDTPQTTAKKDEDEDGAPSGA
jgi:predicted nucleic acid-binding protein